jgi:hypothetical protein
MMVNFHEERASGPLVGMRDWYGEPTISAENEYLIEENRILRSHLPARVPLTNAQRTLLAELAKRMGGRAFKPVN